MRNLNAYSEDAFEFHSNVVESKKDTQRDPNYKERVLALNEDIGELFRNYNERFSENELENLEPHGYNGVEKEDLQKLYSYKSKAIQKLKIDLTTGKNNRVDNICQNCSIGEISSFDHYLPQSEFPEFVVNPLNLIPSCSKCNGFKNAAWRSGGRREFINLYIDTLPEEQYLFVEINANEEGIDLSYYLENVNGIDEDLFALIENHYQKLELLERFKENSSNVIVELEVTIQNFARHLSLDKVRDTVEEMCNDKKVILGNNNWELVLQNALVNNEDYMSRFQNSN